MGSDWYSFVSTTIIGIPIPKEALKSKFEKKGFSIMTIQNVVDEGEIEIEYHGAFLCPEDTTIENETSLEVIGPYIIEYAVAQSKKLDHLDKYLPNDLRDALIKEYESFVGKKPKFDPGFWVVSSTSSYNLDLHSEWAMGSNERVAAKSKKYDGFFYEVQQ
ncbi:hypothetical protein BGZ80_006088 [Entomortierella chlamydospora]|uniref:Uncharacterized protein n=1 Tax=Entomortierella chlamydospora TaxID=101097 RepID=A0A9P6T4A7_9FUNG|nr:hypothetical protein BGZ79_000847 [Entomortierella chlamydospora]KAG0024079.1 hypothetical protein BGZ80_006088 [Entomortierella chlamydospora]